MSMVCPQCNQVYEQSLTCPECQVRLLYQVTFTKNEAPVHQDEEGQWQQTPWGRMGVGLVLAQGLGYGMQQLFTAGILASGEHSTVWSTLWGLALLHGLQGISLLVGGAISGAGQKRGVLYGSLVGILNGLIFLLVQKQTGEVTQMVIYGQPVLHMAFGALGGLIGSLIWRPIPTVEVEEAKSESAKAWPVPSGPRWLAGPVHLGRVFAGIFVVVVGVVWSNVILDWVLNASQGHLTLRTHLQAQMVGWEIAALAILFGAGFAGACTFNGLKQGVCVGIGASVIFLGIQMGSPSAVLEKVLFMILSILILTAAGGWFGGQLFPPVLSGKGRKKIMI